MANRIDLDHARFRGLVRGAIRRDLRKHIANGALTARHGAKTVKVPVPQIELPRFRFGSNEGGGGVGQGNGEPGEPAEGEGQPGVIDRRVAAMLRQSLRSPGVEVSAGSVRADRGCAAGWGSAPGSFAGMPRRHHDPPC